MAPGLRSQALELVNTLNGSYRWITFVVEEDGRITCSSDVFMVPEVAGLFGIAAMGRMFDTLDEVYPRLLCALALRGATALGVFCLLVPSANCLEAICYLRI